MTYEKDRRIAPRIPINKPVELQPEGAVTPFNGTAIDLSERGIGIAGAGFANIGDLVHCGLLFTPKRPLWLPARVVRVAQEEASGDKTTGLLFEDVTAVRGAELRSMIDRVRGTTSNSAHTPIGIDPFCESGTWSRELLVDTALADAVYQEHANSVTERSIVHPLATRSPRTAYGRRELWAVGISAAVIGAAIAAAVLLSR